MFVDVGPPGWDEGLEPVGLACLDQTTHSHRLAISCLRLNVLTKLRTSLTPNTIGCARERCPAHCRRNNPAYRVACTVCQVWDVVCQPLIDRMRWSATVASLQEQLSSSVMFGSKRTFS